MASASVGAVFATMIATYTLCAIAFLFGLCVGAQAIRKAQIVIRRALKAQREEDEIRAVCERDAAE